MGLPSPLSRTVGYNSQKKVPVPTRSHIMTPKWKNPGLGRLLAALLLFGIIGLFWPGFGSGEGVGGVSLRPPLYQRQVAFVDTSVQDSAGLIAGLDPAVVIVRVDPKRDGVEQMQEWLRGQRQVGVIHVMAHGRPGVLRLGTSRLNAMSIRGRHADALAAVGMALGEPGDLLIYGCWFGAGRRGREAVRELARATGADVAASDDPTGSSELGGDWELEIHDGEISAGVAIDAKTRAEWGEILQGICDRTPQVRDRLLEAVRENQYDRYRLIGCRDVTAEHLSTITRLNLEHPHYYQRITALKEDDLSGLTDLRVLSIGNNNFVDLPEGIFRDLSSLERLYLQNSGLHSLPERIFNGLSSLQELFLHDNFLTELPEGLFQGLDSLWALVLYRNEFSVLPEGIFRGLSALQTLSLFGNDLNTLPEGIFRGLSSLRTLLLSSNDLDILPEGVFQGLDRLRYLWLQHNSLRDLPEGIFRGLDVLQRLALNTNLLQTLPEGVFKELDVLGTLWLHANNFAALPEGVLDGVIDTLGTGPDFLGLYVSSDLKAELAFSSTAQIADPGAAVKVTATLSRPLPVTVSVPFRVGGTAAADDFGNLSPDQDTGLLFQAGETRKQIDLTLLGDEDSRGRTVVLTLGGLSEISLHRSDGVASDTSRLSADVLVDRPLEGAVHTVTISDSEGDPVPGPSGICDRTPQVREALLEATGSSTCTEVTAAHLGSLTRLDLSESHITALQAGDFQHLDALEELILSSNALTSVPAGTFHGLNTLKILDLSENRLLFSLSERLFGSLNALEELNLTGNSLGAVPEQIFHGLSSLRELSLGRNSLRRLPEGVFQGLSSLESLWLSRNFLRELPPGVFRGLHSLRELSLQTNRLHRLPDRIFGGLGNLESLWLDRNRLRELPPGVFRGLHSLEKLILGNRKLTVLPGGLFDDVLDTLKDLFHSSDIAVINFAMTTQTPAPGSTARVEVILSRALPVAVHVPFILGGSATPDDYSGLSPSPEDGFLFRAGETRKEIVFTLRKNTSSRDKTLALILGDLAEVGLRRSDGASANAPNLRPNTFVRYPSARRPTHTVTIVGSGSGGGGPESGLDLFIPVILTSTGLNNAFFTSEMTLTNRGFLEAKLNYTYAAHAGGGSGTASEVLPPGHQRIVPDAVEHLQNLGIPIPATGNRIGTLRVEVEGSSEVSVVVRTTTAVPDGRAGLAYPAIPGREGFHETVYLCGLRQNRQDRSNVAFQNMGTSAEGPITVRTTVFSGAADGPGPRVLRDVTLEPGGFHQYSGVLGQVANGYVKVEKVEGTAPFYAYGVINDQANSDGSFVFPVSESALAGTRGQTLPVVLERGPFVSELTVTNFSDAPETLEIDFAADGIQSDDRMVSFSMPIPAGRQHIIPDFIEYARQQEIAGLGSRGGGLAGPLFVTAPTGNMTGIVVGARTGASGRNGQYSLFYNAVPQGGAFTESAWVYALQQNAENRSNLALVNTGEVDDSPSVFSIEIYNGETGQLAETLSGVSVAARRWHQINRILGYASGTSQGYVRITKLSGNNPFWAYGVINDGGSPGQRSGDGAYLPASSASIIEADRRTDAPALD